MIYVPGNGENIGYGAAGASQRRQALKGMTARSVSAREDIDLNNYTMRQRGRLLYMSAPIATSAVNTNRTNVIGNGLTLKSRINRELLGLTREAADEWEKRTEAEFTLWASRKQNCDASGVNDFYGMQQLALTSMLISGDCFVAIKHRDTTTMQPYGLRLHIVEADRISTPRDFKSAILTNIIGQTKTGRRIYDGVELRADGGIAAYYVCNMYPHQALFSEDATWNRIEAYGKKTGLPNILHIMNSERPEQYRGVTFLAPIIEPLLQLRRYTDSELMAALINNYFTVFVKCHTPANMNPTSDTYGNDNRIFKDPDDYQLGTGNINILEADESIEIAESKHPNSGYDTFIRSVIEQMGAALEIPGDLLLKAFSSSYSASRAALLEAWKAIKMRRAWFVSDFCMPVYEHFMSEAIARGRINAPGFFYDPMIRNAWLNCEWIGPSQGQIDPVKEIRAHISAINYGLETHEQASILLNGSNWDSNIEQLSVENKLKLEAFVGLESLISNNAYDSVKDKDDDNE